MNAVYNSSHSILHLFFSIRITDRLITNTQGVLLLHVLLVLPLFL